MIKNLKNPKYDKLQNDEDIYNLMQITIFKLQINKLYHIHNMIK